MDKFKNKQNQSRKSELYESASLVLLLFKCAGLLPIGVTRDKSTLTRWVWSTISIMPYGTFMILHMLFLCVHGYSNLIAEFNIKKFSRFFFDLISVLEMFLLLLFTKTYDKLMRKVDSIENSLPPLRKPGCVTKVSLRITAVVTFFTVLEYIFYIFFSMNIAKKCFILPSDPFIESYFTHIYSWFFSSLPFTYVTAVLLEISRLQIKFTWHLVDTLTLIISYYLVVRFRDFNRTMLKSQKHTMKRSLPWLELQVHYTRLMCLVKIIDKNISCFILASFTLNVCSIGEQIFDILNKVYKYKFAKRDGCVMMIQSDDWIQIVYIVYSVMYLVVRTASVASLAACIHTQSREPLNALYTVPASTYNHDLQTFMDQVYHSKVGLSGLGFFYISREMILTVIATLTTYELVLLQF